ncbi:conserved Plasmodium protein, unknown function [Plasmodium chabaudi chabaudi]|uniref:Uncharacterized protein n=1 Tax=Plasmodium chabaudi chabaudi TaxID=31271 RepID=A0A1D3S250_PLACU|nr:conserved Plasmodium protein, unknown function [Plasmodium chabaudi chabaudi]
MGKYQGPILTALLSSVVGWNLNKLYNKNELTRYGLKNNHNILVVRQISISDKNVNSKSNNNLNDSHDLKEEDILKFIQNINDVNKKYKGYCETSIFKNSTFSDLDNDQNNDESFNKYIVIDKWKTQMNFEQSKKEFEKLFSQKNDIYNKKLQDIYFKYEIFNNNYETISTQNIFKKIFNFILE